MSAEYVDVYQRLVAAGCETDHWQSDLYVKSSPQAIRIVRESGWRFTMFGDKDGNAWLEVPFGYTPFWQQPKGKNQPSLGQG